MGLVACDNAPLPSNVCPCGNRDNMPDCCLCYGFVLQPFDTHTSLLGAEWTLGVPLLAVNDYDSVYCNRASNYQNFLFQSFRSGCRPKWDVQALRDRLLRDGGTYFDCRISGLVYTPLRKNGQSNANATERIMD